MMTLQIKPATPPDFARLAALGKQTFVDAFEKNNNAQDFWTYVNEAFRESTVQQELEDPHAAFFIAYAQEEPVGYLKLRSDHTPAQLQGTRALEIQRIYVQQQASGQGIGAQLLQTALHYAQARGYTTLWLGVWEHNPRAIAFYQKWGFQIFSSHTFMMGTDPQTDLLMQRSVPPLTIVPSLPHDLPEISGLLQQMLLPTQDLTERIFFLVAKNASGQVVGSCGLEIYPPVGLLRSLALAPAYQGQGLGKQLASRLLEAAKEKKVASIFLLTTTAAEFFQNLGFDRIARTSAPEAIQQTHEFARLCPSSAVVMQKRLMPEKTLVPHATP